MKVHNTSIGKMQRLYRDQLGTRQDLRRVFNRTGCEFGTYASRFELQNVSRNYTEQVCGWYKKRVNKTDIFGLEYVVNLTAECGSDGYAKNEMRFKVNEEVEAEFMIRFYIDFEQPKKTPIKKPKNYQNTKSRRLWNTPE